MDFVNVVRVTVLLPFFSLASYRESAPPAPAKLRLTLATLHAASLTTPWTPADSVDGPYFLVSIVGPREKRESIHVPATGHLLIHRDEALGARPLVDLSLEPGDSVHVLISVLEGDKVQGAAEDGAHRLGSAALLLTNEGGTAYWRALECVATCRVLSGGAVTAFAAPGGSPVGGVVELSGSGGTYHMQLQGQRTL